MRKVLAVITALVLAAIVFAPAMGYTISSQGRTNYTSNSERVNYTIGSGMPAHETVYNEEMAEHYPTYSISSTPMPYSIKLGATAKYSINSGTKAKGIEVLGGYRSSAYGSSERVGRGLIVPSEPENATEQAIGHPAPVAKPVAPNVIDLTKPENVTMPTNVTKPENVTMPTNVTKPENVTMPANVTKPENVTMPANVTKPENVTMPTNVTAPVMPAENQTNTTALK